MHVSPAQHAADGPQLAPPAAQLVVLATQRPPLHRPEQHAPGDVQLFPSSRHPTIPSPQTLPVHRPLQHCAALEQLAPSCAHDPAAQRPLVQLSPEQQAPNAPPQICPDPAHVGATWPHRPPKHVPEQHCDGLEQVAPAKPQLTKSSHRPCELQIDGKQHSSLSVQASPSLVHRPEPIESTH